MNEEVKKYLKSFPEEIQIKLKTVRATIKEAAPEAVEAMSYGVPAFKQMGHLVVFAAFKKHIGFYPTPSGIENFKDELKDYETSKGTIKIPFENDIPLELIKRIVEFRVKENKEK